jgi:predicted  nucleic acid-binding Zn-ribbon protein
MADVKRLYELQEIDLEVHSRREELALVDSHLGESEALLEARQAMEAEQGQLHDVKATQHTAEWEASDLEAKIASLEKKLYGGGVKNPKELEDLNHELQIFKQQYSGKEDSLLEIMLKSEAAQEAIKAKTAHLIETEAQWQKEQESLSQRQTELGEALAVLEKKRQAVAAGIEEPDLQLYEKLKKETGGRAVAKATQGMCLGCRISLSMGELKMARGPKLAQCSSCGRIIYLG